MTLNPAILPTSFSPSYFPRSRRRWPTLRTSKIAPIYCHLPSTMLSRDLLEQLQKAWRDSGRPDPAPSYSTLRRVWRTDFPNVKNPRITDYGACSDCLQLRNTRLACDTEDAVRQWKADKQAHQLLHLNERKHLNLKMAEATANPSSLNFESVDGTQSLPYPWLKPYPSVGSV